MGLIEVVDAYRVMDMSFIAIDGTDSEEFLYKSLNFPGFKPEQLSNGLWFQEEFTDFFKDRLRKLDLNKLRNSFNLKGFGLYSVIEQIEDENYEFAVIAKNPVGALEVVYGLNILELEDYNNLIISVHSKELVLTRKALINFIKFLEPQDIIGN